MNNREGINKMRKLPSVCHHDTPQASDDVGATVRARAAESCGFDTTKDLFDVAREVAQRGGPRAVIKEAERRAQRGFFKADGPPKINGRSE